MNDPAWTSQYGEHEFILAHFTGRIGRFLDIGAADGRTFSNTAPLVEAGWSGVMVEPALPSLRALIENWGSHPRVEIVPAAICDWALKDFWEAQTANQFSTLNLKCRDRAAAEGHLFRKRRIRPMSWDTLLDLYSGPYDFVNIDVEGMNSETLETLPFGGVRPKMVCVEVAPAFTESVMVQILRANGLSEQQRIGGNLLAWRPA